MYDFLSFIDSKAIREYNKDRVFTPAEQAVIISNSFKKTLNEKLAALEYLYNTYSAEEFADASVGCHSYEREVPFKTKLGDYISGIKKSLDDRSLTDGYVYKAGCKEIGFDFSDKYFSDYQNAYNYLKELYEEHCEDPETEYVYRISRIKLDNTSERAVTDYEFDNDLRLIFADKDPLPEDSKYDLDISEHFADIPVPFKKGELVKNINRIRCWEKDLYYVSTGRYNYPKRTAKILQHGDYTDMCVNLYAFEPDNFHINSGVYDDHIHFCSLHLDYCDAEDIEKIDKGTKYLAAALDEDCGYDMINLLCDYGSDWRYSWFDIDKYIKDKLGAGCEQSTRIL